MPPDLSILVLPLAVEDLGRIRSQQEFQKTVQRRNSTHPELALLELVEGFEVGLHRVVGPLDVEANLALSAVDVGLRVNLGINLGSQLDTGLDDKQIQLNVALSSEGSARDELCVRESAAEHSSMSAVGSAVVPIIALSVVSQTAQPQSTFKPTLAVAEKTTGITLTHTT